MDDHQDTAYIRDLFENYARTLGQEFHDIQGFNEAYEECMSIARTLLDLEYQIRTGVSHRTETIRHADTREQTVITYAFDLMLFRHEIPLRKPMFRVVAHTKIFGPCTIAIEESESIHPPISSKDEAWLRDTLGSMKSQLLSAWSTKPRDARNQKGT